MDNEPQQKWPPVGFKVRVVSDKDEPWTGRFVLEPGKLASVRIGRAPRSEICIPLDGISALHAELSPDGSGALRIRDLSRNGTVLLRPPKKDKVVLHRGVDIPVPDGAKIIMPMNTKAKDGQREARARISIMMDRTTVKRREVARSAKKQVAAGKSVEEKMAVEGKNKGTKRISSSQQKKAAGAASTAGKRASKHSANLGVTAAADPSAELAVRIPVGPPSEAAPPDGARAEGPGPPDSAAASQAAALPQHIQAAHPPPLLAAMQTAPAPAVMQRTGLVAAAPAAQPAVRPFLPASVPPPHLPAPLAQVRPRPTTALTQVQVAQDVNLPLAAALAVTLPPRPPPPLGGWPVARPALPSTANVPLVGLPRPATVAALDEPALLGSHDVAASTSPAAVLAAALAIPDDWSPLPPLDQSGQEPTSPEPSSRLAAARAILARATASMFVAADEAPAVHVGATAKAGAAAAPLPVWGGSAQPAGGAPPLAPVSFS